MKRTVIALAAAALLVAAACGGNEEEQQAEASPWAAEFERRIELGNDFVRAVLADHYVSIAELHEAVERTWECLYEHIGEDAREIVSFGTDADGIPDGVGIYTGWLEQFDVNPDSNWIERRETPVDYCTDRWMWPVLEMFRLQRYSPEGAYWADWDQFQQAHFACLLRAGVAPEGLNLQEYNNHLDAYWRVSLYPDGSIPDVPSPPENCPIAAMLQTSEYSACLADPLHNIAD